MIEEKLRLLRILYLKNETLMTDCICWMVTGLISVVEAEDDGEDFEDEIILFLF